METRILIVDDDPFICRQLEELYTSQQYAVSSASNAPEALRLLGEHEFSLAVVDLKIPGTDGIGLTREIRDRWPDLDVIMITGYASIKGAVEAIKQGASDYITKPFQKEEILLATEKILEKRRLLDEINYLRSQLSDRYSFANMVSRNQAMHEIFETIGVLSQNDATVLIYGESGTGKELAARAIHFQGKRKGGRFVAINCAAFPDTLLESELFGYERGAFTGAIHDRVGKIELSTAGTLFLDEIESISLNMQLKLLRVLEEREVEKLGSNRRIKVNMRIICATNMDLAAAVAEGRMREDFYYRINVVPLRIPPLRERIEDIPLLAELFLDRLSAGKPRRLSGRALRLLMTHDWPGNVRELANVIERAAVMSPADEIGPGDIRFEDDDLGWDPEAADGLGYEEAKREVLEQFQRRYVERLIAETGGNLSESSRRAGITRAALQRILKRLGIHAHDPPAARAG